MLSAAAAAADSCEEETQHLLLLQQQEQLEQLQQQQLLLLQVPAVAPLWLGRLQQLLLQLNPNHGKQQTLNPKPST